MKTIAPLGARDAGGWMAIVAAVVAALAVGLFGILLAQAPVQAHDHRIPDTVLKKGAKKLQAGTLVRESSWDQRTSENECLNLSTIYRTRFPETDRVAAGSKLRVRISKRQRPDSFRIATYRTADEARRSDVEGRLLKRTLDRVVVDGKTVAWDARFSVNRPSHNYYLIAEGFWQDRAGCGNQQFAHWSFHVKTRA